VEGEGEIPTCESGDVDVEKDGKSKLDGQVNE